MDEVFKASKSCADRRHDQSFEKSRKESTKVEDIVCKIRLNRRLDNDRPMDEEGNT